MCLQTMKARRPGTPKRPRAATTVTPVTNEEAERQWLLSAFARLARGVPDVESLVAFRRRSKVRAWGAGLPGAGAARRRSAGRRIADLARSLDPLPDL